jgi:hypothetical protein
MALRPARWAFLTLATLVLLAQPFALLARGAHAQTESTLISPNPAFSKLGEAASTSLLGDYPCTKIKINVVRNVLNNFVANEEQHCLYTTLYGLTDGTIIQPNGFGKAYPIGNLTGNTALIPIQNHEEIRPTQVQTLVCTKTFFNTFTSIIFISGLT